MANLYSTISLISFLNFLSINNEKYTDENAIIDKSIAIDGKVLVIRKGKKKQYIGIYE